MNSHFEVVMAHEQIALTADRECRSAGQLVRDDAVWATQVFDGAAIRRDASIRRCALLRRRTPMRGRSAAARAGEQQDANPQPDSGGESPSPHGAEILAPARHRLPSQARRSVEVMLSPDVRERELDGCSAWLQRSPILSHWKGKRPRP